MRELPRIRSIVTGTARRRMLTRDVAEEFEAWALWRIIEDNYAILRKFRGSSAFGTYMTVVIAMLLREYRAREWGRWRPSAAARRNGELAIRLETLLYRDAMPLLQAAELLRTAGATTLPDRELRRLAALFPRRCPPRRSDSRNLLTEVASTERADRISLEREQSVEAQASTATLLRAIDELIAEERVIVRMYYFEGASIAEIARCLRIPQKPLYRTLQRALRNLRERMERDGVTRDYAREVASGAS